VDDGSLVRRGDFLLCGVFGVESALWPLLLAFVSSLSRGGSCSLNTDLSLGFGAALPVDALGFPSVGVDVGACLVDREREGGEAGGVTSEA